MVYDQSPKMKLDVTNVSPAKFKENNIRMQTAASDVLLHQDSIMSVDGRGIGTSPKNGNQKVAGYQIPKLPEQDPRKNINILNWKNYKLPARGKQTYLDDVIRYEKKRNVPECKLDRIDWNNEKNSKTIHGISTKDCFHNKSPRVMMNEQITKDAKKRHVPPLGTHSPKHNIVETRIRNLPKSTVALGMLTADAEFLSQQTPAAKYDPNDRLTKPKSFFTKIYEKRKNPDENKIKKSSGPDMGTYDSPRARDQQDFNRTVRI